ncbi:MAG: FAS1-like dehydratase domain-containing protein [Promethearchaeota archaeon]
MSEVSEEELNKKVQQFVGFKTGKSIFRVKGKKMVEYAKAIGDLNPKYVNVGKTPEGKDDYSTIVAHPAFPACFTVQTGGALYSLDSLQYEDGKKLITNMGKLLHTGQEYDYTDCVPIKAGMKLYTEGTISKIWVKNGMLWIEATLESKTKEGEKVCTTTCTVGIRKGGWQ